MLSHPPFPVEVVRAVLKDTNREESRTLVALARSLTRQPAIARAHLVALDRTGAELAYELDRKTRTARIDFPAPLATALDLRNALRHAAAAPLAPAPVSL